MEEFQEKNSLTVLLATKDSKPLGKITTMSIVLLKLNEHTIVRYLVTQSHVAVHPWPRLVWILVKFAGMYSFWKFLSL